MILERNGPFRELLEKDNFVAYSFFEKLSKRQFRCNIVFAGATRKDNFVANAFSRSSEEFMKRTGSQNHFGQGIEKDNFVAEANADTRSETRQN